MKWLLILVVAVCCIGCGKDDKHTNPTPGPTYIHPLAVGNYWKLEIEVYDHSGNVTQRDTAVISVVRDTVVNGETWYGLANNGIVIGGLCINHADGYWVGGPPGRLEYKYPTYLGETYPGGNGSTMTVEDDSNTAYINGRYYTSVSYLHTFPGTYTFSRAKMAPGIGPVLRETYVEGDDHQLYLDEREEILEYSVH